jgi:lipid II:glycine glycyltransferase (peptidoglycan interpeptide bridge formation enzyme)
MQAVFKLELDNTERERIKLFCDSADYCSVEQSLGWSQMFNKAKICYFYLIDEDVIKSFSQIIESFKFANIVFGPVCNEKEIMITSINEIINYYKKHRFIYLGIQLYLKSGYESDYIEYAINKEHSIKYIFDVKNTRSSIEIDLTNNQEDLYNTLRENHKRSIKKAIKLKLKVEAVSSPTDLACFFEVILKMFKARKHELGIFSLDQLKMINNYLVDNKKGQTLIIKDNNDIILGGVILVYQGISVRYFFGASDPERRDVPTLHLALYEAINRAKADNFKYFDLWGYDHFADENDQVFNINRFKRGFGGYFTFLAKKMNINLIPNGYNIYRYLLFIKNISRKSHLIR